MTTIDAVFLSLGCAILLVLCTRKLPIPYPSILVLGGLAVASIPGIPLLTIEPSAILSIFLPAILFEEASHLSWRDMRSKIRLIGLLASTTMIATCAAVAIVATWLFPGIPVIVAIVIGTVIAPADSGASKAILARLDVPRGMITILVGEGLVNDTIAVVLYKLAVAAALGSLVSLPAGLRSFAVMALGGIAVGVSIGWVGARLLRASGEHMIYSLTSLSLAYATYLAAEAIGWSGAPAAAAAGLMCSRGTAGLPAELRFNSRIVWQVVIFALNAFGFLLIGVQLPTVLMGLRFYTAHELIGYAAAISGTILAVRLLAVSAISGLARIGRAREDHRFSWRDDVVIGWSGMRGLVTLAAALGLPPTPEGSVFPYRDLTLFLAFAAIIFTLVGQGLSLAVIVRLLGVGDDDTEREKRSARIAAAKAALEALEQLTGLGTAADLEAIRHEYLARIVRLGGSDEDPTLAPRHETLTEVRLEMIGIERRQLLLLRRRHAIDAETLQELSSELDAAEIALGARRR